MEEQLITLETAKLAKEKGFSLPISSENKYFNDNGNVRNYNWFRIEELVDPIDAITQSLLQRWLREKYNIFVTVDIPYERYGRYSALVWGVNKSDGNKLLLLDGMTVFNTYEDALEEGLQETLKYIN